MDESEILHNFEAIVFENLSDYNLTNVKIAAQLFISERKLYRIIYKLTGQSPNLYIRKIKMEQAMNLLLSGKYIKVKEVSIQVGFQKTEYFARLFKQEFGISPSAILRNKDGKYLK